MTSETDDEISFLLKSLKDKDEKIRQSEIINDDLKNLITENNVTIDEQLNKIEELFFNNNKLKKHQMIILMISDKIKLKRMGPRNFQTRQFKKS